MENKRRFPLKKPYLLIIIAVSLLALAAGGVTLRYGSNQSLKALKPEKDLEGIDWGHQVARHFDEDMINILLLGFDRTASRDEYFRLYRPDTIMIFALNLKTKQVNLLSIPRDSHVKISGLEGYDKINSAYMYGYDYLGSEGNRHQSGLNTVLGTVQEFLGGVPIHYYLKMDMDAVVAIIEGLGGVDYEVDVQVRDSENQRLLLDKGRQHLGGRQFLDYVCFRGVDGDLGRIKRQQNILISTFSQLKKSGKLANFPAVIGSLNEGVESNLTRSQMGALALFGGKVNERDIKSLVFPGNPQYVLRDGQDVFYLVVNEKVRVEIIKLVFGVTVDEDPQTVLPGWEIPQGEREPSPRPQDWPSDQDYLPGFTN